MKRFAVFCCLCVFAACSASSFSMLHALPGLKKGTLYVVGAGCGDPDLITVRGLTCIRNADALVCMEGLRKVFRDEIGDKPVLFDPMLQVGRFYQKRHPGVSLKDSEIKAAALYRNNIKTLRDYLRQGKTVVLIEPGDPSIYGGWKNWIFPHIKKKDIVVIPGISSFNAANAMFRDGDITKTSVILTEPIALIKDELMIKNAARAGNSIVIFMGLNRVQKFTPALQRYFPGTTPAAVVYYAGYRKREKIIRTDLNHLVQVVKDNREPFMGLIYIGRDLPRE